MEIDLINHTGTITLNSGHSLVIGNKPTLVDNDVMLKLISENVKTKESIENFGLFESSTPNYTTYYPDVSADDLNPKDDDFIYPIFRALSATVVWKGYKPIDFSKNNGQALKEAMGLLVGQSINADHETALGNAMGAVRSVMWQDSYTVDGVKVPAGINAEFKIDGKSNPRIARGIMMEPPSIHSNSVSVKFEWEPSHKETSDNDFFNKLGSRDSKGELYRLIVTKVIHFSETSLVSHGADPFAQIIKNGKINNPTYASKVYNFSANDSKGKAVRESHVFDYKMDLSFSADDSAILNNLHNNLNNNENQFNMELLKLLEEKFGLDAGILTKENASEKIAEVLSLKETEKAEAVTLAVTEVQGKLDAAELKITDLETETAALKIKSDKFEAQLLATREETKRLYKLAKGDNADEALLTLIDNSEEATLTSLAKSYKDEVEAKFPITCKSCGSTELNRTSSEGGEGGGGNGGSPKVLSNDLARKALRDKKRKQNK